MAEAGVGGGGFTPATPGAARGGIIDEDVHDEAGLVLRRKLPSRMELRLKLRKLELLRRGREEEGAGVEARTLVEDAAALAFRSESEVLSRAFRRVRGVRVREYDRDVELETRNG